MASYCQLLALQIARNIPKNNVSESPRKKRSQENYDDYALMHAETKGTWKLIATKLVDASNFRNVRTNNTLRVTIAHQTSNDPRTRNIKKRNGSSIWEAYCSATLPETVKTNAKLIIFSKIHVNARRFFLNTNQ